MNFIKFLIKAITKPPLSADDLYLSKAVDHVDLDKRMRELDRATSQRFTKIF